MKVVDGHVKVVSVADRSGRPTAMSTARQFCSLQIISLAAGCNHGLYIGCIVILVVPMSLLSVEFFAGHRLSRGLPHSRWHVGYMSRTSKSNPVRCGSKSPVMLLFCRESHHLSSLFIGNDYNVLSVSPDHITGVSSLVDLRPELSCSRFPRVTAIA
jgi:hypothetical protein